MSNVTPTVIIEVKMTKSGHTTMMFGQVRMNLEQCKKWLEESGISGYTIEPPNSLLPEGTRSIVLKHRNVALTKNGRHVLCNDDRDMIVALPVYQ